eukprot:2674823-Prymnesium_polylepis.2
MAPAASGGGAEGGSGGVTHDRVPAGPVPLAGPPVSTIQNMEPVVDSVIAELTAGRLYTFPEPETYTHRVVVPLPLVEL